MQKFLWVVFSTLMLSALIFSFTWSDSSGDYTVRKTTTATIGTEASNSDYFSRTTQTPYQPVYQESDSPEYYAMVGWFGWDQEIFCPANLTFNTYLMKNVSVSGDCLNFLHSNITLDCQGFTIFGDDTGKGLNISDQHDIHIKNCNFKDFKYAVYVYNSHDITFDNISIEGVPGYAIRFESSTNNNFQNTRVYDSEGYIYSPSQSNSFSDIVFGYNSSVGLLEYANLDISNSIANSSNILLNPYFVSVNSSALSDFNKSANITIRTTTCKSPAVYKALGLPDSYAKILSEGTVCTNCIVHSCNPTELIIRIEVPSFSGYAVGNQTYLKIWDDTDNLDKYVAESIKFYANYSNISSEEPILNADCTISFIDGTSDTMSYNSASKLYEYSRSFDLPGSYYWNVTCNSSNFEDMFAEDTAHIKSKNLTQQVELVTVTIDVGTTGKFLNKSIITSLVVDSGNITVQNLSASGSTEKWTAFYGNVSARLHLAQSDTASSVREWDWSPSDGGIVCLSTNSSLSTFDIYPATGGEIDEAWDFDPSDMDSGTKTFNETNCTLRFGSKEVSMANYVDTGKSGGFITCSFKTKQNETTKKTMLFCSNISDNTLWNNKQGNYEIVVPTDNDPQVYETYYFYVRLG